MLARVQWCDTVRPGEAFAPMHWSDQFARQARVGSLIASVVDPLSGQPEFKATAVAIRPVAVAWHGFLLSRRELGFDSALYLARARGRGYWRYELADSESPASWPEHARQLLAGELPRADGSAQPGNWVEYSDPRAGLYRAALLEQDRLAACLFVSPTTRLPDRGWLSSLFETQALNAADRLSLLAGRPADGSASVGPIVCACFSVGRDALARAIASQQATDAREIGKLLKAGTNCGSCVPELNALLAALRPAVAAAGAAEPGEAGTLASTV
jgi:assimilatory nitrate reductase catalytic subunit